MNRFSNQDLGATLRFRLGKALRIAIIGVGDELQPFDRLGMVAAKKIEQLHLEHVAVFLAATVPESVTGPVRRFRPDHTVFLDAADMGVQPGTIAVIDPKEIRAGLFSTHALPLPVVMDYIAHEIGTGVTLLGIQPDSTHPENDLSGEDQGYLDRNLLLLSAILRDRG
ncbi:MAG: hydrogenase 3 maturation endopeptidase HyCI [Methanoregula sp.]|nr:hydrogenase 3 maturation endopeptidase HyCI [Methanoregula sp.]